MEQFEQLLTCAICLDRYRNPKLLPCQHSFCMEPCMDGLVDYVRRQVKCPECRAEHRIPYQGVQGYPTNVTLQRFLELHIEITGELPDPTSGQTMKRCGVCSEKAYVTICVHCDKEICTDCKGAHMDILRREISRINNQVRRAMHRLQDILAVVEKNMLALQLNCTSVSEEVDEIYKRLAKALKDRTEYLRGEIDRYLTTELKNLSTLKENLQQEISNIQANCDLANKEMQSEEVEWDDCELMDAKEIFLKTIDFIRNFEAETGDYNRRVRFAMAHDPNQLVLHVAGYGELTIHMPHQPLVGFNTSSPAVGSNMLQPPGPGLMRSKSDHRLASQFRAQEDRGGYDNVDQSGRVSPLGGRKFGERYTPRSGGDRYDNRYRGVGSGEYGDYTDSTYGDGDNNRLTTRSRLRSRFGRHTGGDDSDNDGQSGRTVRFLETHVPLQSQRERERVLDTEDVSKGPLSGITRLYDSPRVMKRIQDSKTKDKRKPSETPAKTEVQSQRKAAGAMAAPVRQVSEEDEISRIKRQNKASSSSETTTETMAPARTMVSERVASLKREESKEPTSHSTLQPRKTSASVTADSSEDESDDESGSSPQQCKTPVPTVTKATSRRSSASSDATTTSQSGTRESGPTPTSLRTKPKEPDEEEGEEEEESETSSESEETSDSSKSEDETEPIASAKTEKVAPMEKTDIGPLLARSANARDTTMSRKSSRDEGYKSSRYGTNDSSYRSPYQSSKDSETASTGRGEKDGAALSSWARYLKNKYGNRDRGKESKEGAAGASGTSGGASGSVGGVAGSSVSRRLSVGLPLRHNSTSIESSDDDQKNTQGSPHSPTSTIAATAATPQQAGFTTVGSTPKSQYMQKRRQLFKIGSRGSEPGYFTWPRGIAVGPDNSIVVADSSNHRVQVFDSNGIFLKEFGSYGNAEGEFDCLAGIAVNRIGQYIIADRYNHRVQVLDPSGRFLRAFGSQGTTDGKFNYPWGVTTDALGFIYVCDKENHRIQVFQSDGTFVGKFGSNGSKLGQLEHPHYIAISNTNRVIVSDSNNHRVQVFDVNGRVLSSFGTEGSEQGQFKFPRGVAVDDQGFISVGDSGNNRIQIFNPDGSFLKAFGCWGSGDGEFKGLEGVAVMSNGNILVCDRENHRIQVF
ncbi:unnamed protein product [Bemisia tabaci]|uniref:RING finger protein nhl-1 n=1 Tax=Bemisia tabaci TaxID=7038 RepID=A0A9P0G4A6_BEMTA|nr:unnamed protein product [Bemisia tabaci]